MSESKLLMAFYGDDFTGSTDAMESLALAGIRTILFTHPPTREELDAISGLQAFGVASRTRSMPPHLMGVQLRDHFARLRKTGVPLVHYKVCSTFDSAPTVGSIGCAIDVGADTFGTRCVPIVGGAPHLGRHCVFGNLFACGSGDSSPLRLDRHPNMMNHPVTPMTESDLRLHLGWQTEKPIELFDVTRLSDPTRYLQLIESHRGAVLIDFLSVTESTLIGMHLLQHAQEQPPLFVVGSSGVEVALAAYWKRGHQATFPMVTENGPLLVAVGSCSPVTARQITSAKESGFGVALLAGHEIDDLETIRDVSTQLVHGRSVVLHTGGAGGFARQVDRDHIGKALAKATRAVIERTRIKRLLVAGGDTSGQIADALAITSLEMIAPLVRGAPLCRATSSIPEVDGLEVVFKGGQIGGDDFFGLVQRGTIGTHP